MHLGFIDALRGWAFLLVLLLHTSIAVDLGTSGIDARLKSVCQIGGYGVQLFFVISAFTLFQSLETRSREDRRPWPAFLARRLFRIAPLFWVAILFYLAWYWPGQPFFAPDGVSPGCRVDLPVRPRNQPDIVQLGGSGRLVGRKRDVFLRDPAVFLPLRSNNHQARRTSRRITRPDDVDPARGISGSSVPGDQRRSSRTLGAFRLPVVSEPVANLRSGTLGVSSLHHDFGDAKFQRPRFAWPAPRPGHGDPRPVDGGRALDDGAGLSVGRLVGRLVSAGAGACVLRSAVVIEPLDPRWAG